MRAPAELWRTKRKPSWPRWRYRDGRHRSSAQRWSQNQRLMEIVLHDLDPQRGALARSLPDLFCGRRQCGPTGKVTRPAQDRKLTPTVTAAYGEATQTREFSVTVPAQRAAGGDEAYADAQNPEPAAGVYQSTGPDRRAGGRMALRHHLGLPPTKRSSPTI